MAFGFGFNKQKVLSAAEKFVQQGRLQNAIAEYEKILKNDPRDLTVANTVLGEPYLCTDQQHQGLILHSVYHRPRGWDAIAPGQKVPNGQCSMWGDYHARELALLILREARGENYLTFF